jgi:arsenical pump membrane protein
VAITFRLGDGPSHAVDAPPLRLGLGAAATVGAAVLVVALPNAALPVFAIGVTATALRRHRPRIDARALALLFALAVGLGTLARLWHGPSHVLETSGAWGTAGIGALASLLVNNLPAAVLLSARQTAHPDALLLGLDLGPNLAVTGSLSALLWLQSARTVDARASIGTYTRLGLLLVPVSLVPTLAALLATRT